MEERRKLGLLGTVGLALLILVLAAACYLSAGLKDLSLGMGPWGLYTTDGDSLYLAAAYLETDTRDLLITSRNGIPADGGLVTYEQDGCRTVDLYDDLLGRPVLAGEDSRIQPEPVLYILHDGGVALQYLHQWRWCIWGVTAVMVLALLVLKLTANARWRKRQQKLMRKNFQLYGEKYDQEEEDLDY